MEHGPIKVGMVILMQPDLKKAVEFYKDKLGLPLQFHLENKWAEFDLGCVKFGLCPIEQNTELIRTGIVLETQGDLVEFYDKMKNDIEFLGEPVVAVHGIMVGIKDPGGNVIDMYQATPEKMKDLMKDAAQEDVEDGCCKPDASCESEQDECCQEDECDEEQCDDEDENSQKCC